MNVQDLLPIGSVVRLKDAKKLLMIIGIKIVSEDEKQYDYISVMYPEGYISKEIHFKFNHDDIEEILFEGFRTEEQKEFLYNVQKVLEDKEDAEN